MKFLTNKGKEKDQLMDRLNVWKNHLFESGIDITPDFKRFATQFKREISKDIESAGLKIAEVTSGHFYIFGFVVNPLNNKYAYFSLPDVRFGQPWGKPWHKDILVRTVQGPKDYQGGYNQKVTLDDLVWNLVRLTQ